MIQDERRLKALLGAPALVRLVKQMARRLRLGKSLTGTLSLVDPAEEERRGIDSLLGRRPSVGNPLVVRLEELEGRLRVAGVCDSLEEGVRAVVGGIVNEPQERAARAREWSVLRESLEPALCGLPQYRACVDRMFASGSLKKMTGRDCRKASVLMGQLMGVLKSLPQEFTALARFAEQVTGDSHGLDAGTALSTLCLKAIADGGGLEFKPSAGGRRRLWEAVGVVVDELSHPVLTLNLRGDMSHRLGRMLEGMREAGEPCYLTVRQLRRAEPGVFKGQMERVYVCENPSVVAGAAQGLGARCAAMVCTAGQPGSAAQMLLGLLNQAGCRLMYHGDLDPSGVRIANLVIQRFGATPWRMGSGDYLARVDAGCPKFKGRGAGASWDEALEGHLKTHGRAVLEEGVMELLLEDLGR